MAKGAKVWIGMYKDLEMDKYQWSNSLKEDTSYTNWAEDQPNGNVCVAADEEWYSLSCHTHLGFVCQMY